MIVHLAIHTPKPERVGVIDSMHRFAAGEEGVPDLYLLEEV
jgi:hypothetical protein